MSESYSKLHDSVKFIFSLLLPSRSRAENSALGHAKPQLRSMVSVDYKSFEALQYGAVHQKLEIIQLYLLVIPQPNMLVLVQHSLKKHRQE
jgi:hypothetical protein